MMQVSSDPKIEEEILEAEEKLQFPDNEPVCLKK